VSKACLPRMAVPRGVVCAISASCSIVLAIVVVMVSDYATPRQEGANCAASVHEPSRSETEVNQALRHPWELEPY